MAETVSTNVHQPRSIKAARRTMDFRTNTAHGVLLSCSGCYNQKFMIESMIEVNYANGKEGMNAEGNPLPCFLIAGVIGSQPDGNTKDTGIQLSFR